MFTTKAEINAHFLEIEDSLRSGRDGVQKALEGLNRIIEGTDSLLRVVDSLRKTAAELLPDDPDPEPLSVQ